jgi:hypothetical protein
MAKDRRVDTSGDYTAIEALVEPAFGDPVDVEAVHRFLEPIRQNMLAADVLCHRALRNIVLAGVSYELLVRDAITVINLGIAQVKDLAIVQQVLPVVLAYCCYQLWAALSARRIMMEAHHKGMGIIRKGDLDADERRFFQPPSLLGIEILLSTFAVGGTGKFWRFLTDIGQLTIVLVPLALVGSALWRNTVDFGATDWLVLATWALSLLLVIKALLSVMVASRALNSPPLPSN